MPPTEEQLDALIRTRLELIGVDLSDLPATGPDPVSGSPSQADALEHLRSILTTTVPTISGWQPLPSDPALGQQVAPPALYPAQYTAWTDGGLA